MIAMCEVAGYVVTVSGNSEDDILHQAVHVAKISYGILSHHTDVKVIAYFDQETKSWK